MMSSLVKWGVGVVLLVGIMLFLQSRVSEQPLTMHEKPVSIDALAK
jgi:hypothetical protein